VPRRSRATRHPGRPRDAGHVTPIHSRRRRARARRRAGGGERSSPPGLGVEAVPLRGARARRRPGAARASSRARRDADLPSSP
jgi:hypothetical protein